jgi:hypothetical protein
MVLLRPGNRLSVRRHGRVDTPEPEWEALSSASPREAARPIQPCRSGVRDCNVRRRKRAPGLPNRTIGTYVEAGSDQVGVGTVQHGRRTSSTNSARCAAASRLRCRVRKRARRCSSSSASRSSI